MTVKVVLVVMASLLAAACTSDDMAGAVAGGIRNWCQHSPKLCQVRKPSDNGIPARSQPGAP